MAQKRINKELNDLAKNPQNGIEIFADENNIYKWTALIQGLENTPYEGGIFKILIDFPTDYPFKPPKFKFGTKIYHPNVSETSGAISMTGICCSDKWSPAL